MSIRESFLKIRKEIQNLYPNKFIKKGEITTV